MSMHALRQESKLRQRLLSEVHELEAEFAESMISYNFRADQIESARRANLPEPQRADLIAQTIAAADQEWAKVQAVRDRLNMAIYDLNDFEGIISDMHTEGYGKSAATLA